MEKETKDFFWELVEIIRIARGCKHFKVYDGDMSKLTMTQISVLQFLRDNEKANMGELSEHARVKMPTMTDTINRLVRYGYVKRKHSQTDRRQVWISITEKGMKVIDENRHHNMKNLDEYVKMLNPKERTMAIELARKFKKGLEIFQ